MTKTRKYFGGIILFIGLLFSLASPLLGNDRISVIFDTDANNELDDQHALAYLLFNGDVFDVVGVTVNATKHGGDISQHYAEAERVMKLCNVFGEVPLYAGANGDFEAIRQTLYLADYDGADAVEFIIREAKRERDQKLVLLPVGKLTNIALAILKAPEIKENVRIVWLGSNYPRPGEYNLEDDIASMNYLLDQDVDFEIVTVRYSDSTGSTAVKTTPAEMHERMPGAGVKSEPVEGRHGGVFTTFGDYSIDLFSHCELYGDPPSRSLFDVVAVAILKNENWGKRTWIPAPIMMNRQWVERPQNPRKTLIWEHFDVEAITEDFFETINNPHPVSSGR